MTPTPAPELITWLSRQGWDSGPEDWQRLSGGQTNNLWQVSTGTGVLVVKLFCRRSDNPLFPNSAPEEARMLRHLAPLGLAPVLLAEGQLSAGPVLVYPHQPGQVWGSAGSGGLQQVAEGLARLHATPAPEGLRQLEGGSAALARQGDRILSQLPDTLPESLRAALIDLRPEGDIPPTPQPCLLHGDPVPGNLILNGSEVVLIDWQCPAVGDPVEDLAIFLSPAMQHVYRGAVLSAVEQKRFLAAYDNPALTARLRAMAPWHHWRMAAYCAWKAAQGHQIYQQAYALERAALITTRAQQRSG